MIIRKGRMDDAEMSAFFAEESPRVVVDATHPHAAEVSGNIRAAAGREDKELIRVVRPETEPVPEEGCSEWEKASVYCVSSPAEALEYLKMDDDNILLTTGSKELPEFMKLPGASGRIYARVIPQSSTVSFCESAGLSGCHIIAMQGPFSTEMNIALINSVNAGWLVTKESGENGGFREKMEAAAMSGIRVIVIQRPVKEDGLSLEETKDRLLKIRKTEGDAGDLISEKDDRAPEITLIGLGMGGGSQLTLEAVEALKGASVIFGAERMLKDISSYAIDTPLIALYKCKDIFSYLSEHPGYDKACVVFSGDTGFFSGCADFEEQMDGCGIRILPGISSFSCLCARFGLRQEEFYTASAHGKETDIAALIRKHKKVFLLLDPDTTVGVVCRALIQAGYKDARIYAGIRLGYEDEELLSGKAGDLSERDQDRLAVMAFEREEADHA